MAPVTAAIPALSSSFRRLRIIYPRNQSLGQANCNLPPTREQFLIHFLRPGTPEVILGYRVLGSHFGVAMRCAFFSAPQRPCHPRSSLVCIFSTGYPGGHFGVAMRCAFFSAPQRPCHPRSSLVCIFSTGYPGGHFGVAMRCAFFSAPQRPCHPRSSLVCIFSTGYPGGHFGVAMRCAFFSAPQRPCWVRIAGEAGPTWRGSGKPPGCGRHFEY